ncbi:MAG: histidine kinase [Bradyrhizobium sp. PARBB1]|uniref:trifunctional serine/threonine-protein kinase/ATP-binding protein/sensor histidine kinase n=1 Tax=Bradyrhizobium sp. TaxID=376 RepID=UPI000BDCD9A7|nr:ATP-binding sensor histidine kinase [uncultured Bradyrhizobium sp.]MCA3794895.1 AAA family ATPase [Burkholderia sp.]OYU61766.1 MAG: histidine kinase [Bradyrhizobium sp. PARBB1]PSO17651.1 histidine kinase [Bradyrhizobium sp. MOS004]HAQ81220.1 PAS domain S-box protein [Bradyrhizobium sp.]HAR18256.1 PAS domain S-box protein [Bradyrhizobium sp.]
MSQDSDRVLYRTKRRGKDGGADAVLVLVPTVDRPSPSTVERLKREYELRHELALAGAIRPLELASRAGQTALVLEDPGGEPLQGLLGAAMDPKDFLHLALGTVAALGSVHRHGIVHKDIKPAHILVNCLDGRVRLTGFGIASRLRRERHGLGPPELIAGTFAYMAPEQTGRMNRSVDSRSDLYALGVTFYQMLTGQLPFVAADPMGWVNCHIAQRPVSVRERRPDISDAISAIVMKLLAKTAEDRYQTAIGVEEDLRRCLANVEIGSPSSSFPLGQNDVPDRLIIPEKLYGRLSEIRALLAAFDHVVRTGSTELVLISGYAGIGKSSVVGELHKSVVTPRGVVASGKCDPHQRNVPYFPVVQAFEGLVQSLLSTNDAELASWRLSLQEALGPNGRLVVDLVPELRLIVGEPPPVPELPAQQAQSRFQLTIRRFVAALARAEHPLILIIDDLQWVDAATLDLIEDLLTRSNLQHLLLVGAYRDNEVEANHPLIRRLERIRELDGRIRAIELSALTVHDLQQLIADTLHSELASVAQLAQIVYQKTGGNPFFVSQFVSLLAEEGSLTFDYTSARWSWDLERIRAMGCTDNVVDLMVGKLARLPIKTQAALRYLACLGNAAGTTLLSTILESTKEGVEAALWPALHLGLLERRADSYRFAHDRVQEAAYSMISEEERADYHLLIGHLMLTQTALERREEAIFDIVNQLNHGVARIDRDKREQLAELNLLAARRAKDSNAYASALSYLSAGAGLLSDHSQKRQLQLPLSFELIRAECEFLTGALTEAEQRLELLSARAITTADRAAITSLQIDLHTTFGRNERAVLVGLAYLNHLGCNWSLQPTDDEARRQYNHICSQLKDRTVEDLLKFPLLLAPEALATIDILLKMSTPAFLSDPNLWILAVCKVLSIGLEQGNSEGTCLAYVGLGLIAGKHFGDYENAFRFGQTGYELIERLGFTRLKPRIYLHFGAQLMLLTKHVRAGRELLRRAAELARENGDLLFAGYSDAVLVENMLASGDALLDAEKAAVAGLEFARKARFSPVVDWLGGLLGLIQMLRGRGPKFGSLGGDELEERKIESDLLDSGRTGRKYWIHKLRARFFAGEYAEALEIGRIVEKLLWSLPSPIEAADYYLYSSLSLSAHHGSVVSGDDPSTLETLISNHEELEALASACSENFADQAALVGAEIARIRGKDIEAMRLFESAIRSARSSGFVQNEALAHELAARFYLAHGLETVGRVHLQEARYCYKRWGADGKVLQLDALHPCLGALDRNPFGTRTIEQPIEHLDLAIVLQISQAIAGEIALERLVEKLTRLALAQAGAERAVLVLSEGMEERIVAEATANNDGGGARFQCRLDTALPRSVLQYVMRTRKTVILDDATVEPSFAADRYIQDRRARSVLCLPLVTQDKLVGAIYLENNLVPRAFVPTGTAVLKLLASQAAIALENARLYRELEEREAKIRRLVDANIVGICISGRDGGIFEANDAFLKIAGYEREDLSAGRLRWADLTGPARLGVATVPFAALEANGAVQQFEDEYVRRDGTRVPVMVGTAAIDERQDRWVTFVVDLTERKRAEAQARRMEKELAHANRVATMGQLTASIAHEVKQPIGAMVTNAQAAQRLLRAEPPDLEEAWEALMQIAQDGKRAGDVIDRIRGLVKRTSLSSKPLDINQGILEVVELTRGEAVKYGVCVRTDLSAHLPPVKGDRVELQQVVLNLVINAMEATQSVDDRSREVLIETAVDNSDVLVRVRDTGGGLSSFAIERLFTAFFTTKPGGLGLGLSICQSIIESHGGRLFAGANVPRGAVFQFTLPAIVD